MKQKGQSVSLKTSIIDFTPSLCYSCNSKEGAFYEQCL